MLRLIVVCLLGQACAQHITAATATLSPMFSYDSSSSARNSIQEFRLAVPEGQYNGSHPGVSAGDGAIWLVPNPDISPSPHSAGRIVYRQQIQLKDDTSGKVASFRTSFKFQIITTGAYGRCADGVAFFISKDSSFPPNSTGKYLGLANETTNGRSTTHLFAVEFDTFRNAGDVMDPSPSHVGLDVNGLKSSETNDTSSGDLDLYGNYTFIAWVDFNASTRATRVWMVNTRNVTSDFSSSSDQLPSDQFLVKILEQTDISTAFQNYMYVGMSASTGSYVGGYAIYSWEFSVENISLAVVNDLDKESALPTILLGVCIPAGIIISGVFAMVFWKNHGRFFFLQVLGYKMGPQVEMPGLTVPQLRYADLYKGTKGFSDKMLLGEGAFSQVYKGILASDGSLVAVKKLKHSDPGQADFISEVSIISSIRHRHLLQLRGWCYERGQALMVYEFMKNGSLDSHLFGKAETAIGLSSKTRFNILVGVASALEYLHQGLGECVLHRDVKAANVLLNEEFEATLGDFGLARLIAHDKMVTMTAAGTMGYVAPEVVYTGKATDRADVYSFGILALEVASGRRVLDYRLQPQDANLLEWVWLLQRSSKLLDALDPSLYHDIPLNATQGPRDDDAQSVFHEAEKRWTCVLHLGLHCCHLQPDARPTSSRVHQVLKEGTILPLANTRPEAWFSSSRLIGDSSISSILNSTADTVGSSSQDSSLVSSERTLHPTRKPSSVFRLPSQQRQDWTKYP